MRLTPAAASSPTENDFPLIPTMKLTGFDTAEQTAPIAARSGRPGAKSTSAPALSKGLKTTDGVVQARRGVEEIVRSRSQDEGNLESTCCLRGCCNPFDGQPNIIKGTVLVASRILDRASNQS